MGNPFYLTDWHCHGLGISLCWSAWAPHLNWWLRTRTGGESTARKYFAAEKWILIFLTSLSRSSGSTLNPPHQINMNNNNNITGVRATALSMTRGNVEEKTCGRVEVNRKGWEGFVAPIYGLAVQRVWRLPSLGWNGYILGDDVEEYLVGGSAKSKPVNGMAEKRYPSSCNKTKVTSEKLQKNL